LKLNVEVPLVVFCWSEPKAQSVMKRKRKEGSRRGSNRGFGVADLEH